MLFLLLKLLFAAWFTFLIFSFVLQFSGMPPKKSSVKSAEISASAKKANGQQTRNEKPKKAAFSAKTTADSAHDDAEAITKPTAKLTIHGFEEKAKSRKRPTETQSVVQPKRLKAAAAPASAARAPLFGDDDDSGDENGLESAALAP